MVKCVARISPREQDGNWVSGWTGHSGHSLLLLGWHQRRNLRALSEWAPPGTEYLLGRSFLQWKGVRQTLCVHVHLFLAARTAPSPDTSIPLLPTSSWSTCGRWSCTQSYDTLISAQQVFCLTKSKDSIHQHSQIHKVTHKSSWSSQYMSSTHEGSGARSAGLG